MSAARSERLVNLVVCLLATRQFLPADRIRTTVAGYDEAPTDEAFFRMLERDKAELRELGVPLETGRNSHFDAVDGYRIARRDYELPEITLEPDEAAALGVAAQLWDSPDLAAAARTAVLKLRAAGVAVEPGTTPGPRVRATDPAFDPLVAAVEAGRTVRFRHRRGPTAEATERTVDPWGVVSYRGRWYLVGHDHLRDDVRCFRLSRITDVRARGAAGAVTVPDVDLLALVEASAGPRSGPVTARLRLAPGRAQGLRRHARTLAADDGGDVVEVELPGPGAARELAGHGADVVVLDPPELAAEVVALLRGAAGRTGEEQP
ncbi:WYL domain-containing protein [Rhodococcus aerolatus]